MFNALIPTPTPSVIFFFFPSFSPLLSVCKDAKQRLNPLETSPCVSAHYIILSSRRAPRLPLLWTITVVDSPRVFGELQGSQCQ